MKTENGVKRGTGLSKVLAQKNLCIEREGKGSLNWGEWMIGKANFQALDQLWKWCGERKGL